MFQFGCGIVFGSGFMLGSAAVINFNIPPEEGTNAWGPIVLFLVNKLMLILVAT